MTYLYIISVNGDDFPCKVGISEDPDKRLASLQSGSPSRLVVREIFWVESRERAAEIERRFQDEHVERRMNSEWFGMTFEQVNSSLFNMVEWPRIEVWRQGTRASDETLQ